MDTLREALEKINIGVPALFDEPMSAHTSFGIGGPADAYLRPRDPGQVSLLLAFARDRGLPVQILGGGSNVLVSDKGLRGLTLDLSLMDSVRAEGRILFAQAGASMEAACRAALAASLSGLEFASGLPGSVGGAAYMNARCYDREMADLLPAAEFLRRGAVESLPFEAGDWGYKKSPFQPGGPVEGSVILSVALSLEPGDAAAIERAMAEKRRDREAKGHYRFPCAGSVFKNDRAFGEPTGRILDRLGLRGLSSGGAAVADYHANIFVNKGGASASDLKALIELAERRALSELGLVLEREVILLGDFS